MTATVGTIDEVMEADAWRGGRPRLATGRRR